MASVIWSLRCRREAVEGSGEPPPPHQLVHVVVTLHRGECGSGQ